MPKPKVPYHCKVCGDLNPKNFYKDRKNLCKTHFKELVSSSKCDEEKTIIEEQIKELDNQDAEIAKRDEQIDTLNLKVSELDKEIENFNGLIQQLQKDLDFNTRKNNQLDNKYQVVLAENKDLKYRIIQLENNLQTVINVLHDKLLENEADDDAESVKSEKSVKSVNFDIPVIKPKGSAEKKGISYDDIIYYKNRINSMNGKELKKVAEMLKISTKKPKPEKGDKLVDVLRKEVREKLDSYL
jgi:chromosome segregation ATPase